MPLRSRCIYCGPKSAKILVFTHRKLKVSFKHEIFCWAVEKICITRLIFPVNETSSLPSEKYDSKPFLYPSGAQKNFSQNWKFFWQTGFDIRTTFPSFHYFTIKKA